MTKETQIATRAPSSAGALTRPNAGPDNGPDTRALPRLPAPVLLVTLGIGCGVSLLTGFFWLAGGFALSALFVLQKIVKIKTTLHESALSESPSLKSLRDRLGSLMLESSLHALASRAQNQLNRVDLSLKQASRILSQKLDPGELAYSRFQNGFNDAAVAGFAQLQDVATQLLQASAIGPSVPAAAPMKQKVLEMLDENEAFLDSLSSAVANLAAMETNSARIETSQAMEELKQIADRAKSLSLKH